MEPLEGRTLLSFVTAPSYPVGYGAEAVAMADFNNDGDVDVATVDNYAGTVSVLLGNGDGSFQPAKETVGVRSSYTVVAGDFDEDGATDLAVAGGGTVSLLLGNGDGTFQPPVDFPVGDGTTALVAGDFNGDDNLDLAVLNPGGNTGMPTVNVLLGNGDGTFLPSTPYPTGGLPVALAVADLNRDGASDLAVLVVAASTSRVNVLLGNGDGSFRPATGFAAGAGYPLSSLATGDFNADGATDLAAATISGDSSVVSVLLGNGDGTLRAPVGYAVGSRIYTSAMTAGDWDGDGDTDLFTANEGSNSVSVLTGRGDGTFRPAVNFIVGSQPRTLAAGDVDGDGDDDLAVVNSDFHIASGTPPTVTMLVSTDGTFVAPRSYAAGSHPTDVAAGDFNEDGFRDLAVTNLHSGHVSVFLGNGDGSFQPERRVHIMDSAGLFISAVIVADYNNDGHQDLAVCGSSLIVLLGRGDGTFGPPTFYPIVPTFLGSMAAADFNGDGALDLATMSYGVHVSLGNDDGTFRPSAHYETDENPEDLAIGDFNNDGAIDLVTANYYGAVNLLLGNGDGTFQPARRFASGARSVRVAASDFDGDGNFDLAVGNGQGLTVLLGNGDATFQPPVDYPVPASGDVEVADFNRDGVPDLATGSSVQLGRGDGTFLPHVRISAGVDGRGLVAADFDGDGAPDLAVANQRTNSAAVLINDGNRLGAAVTGRRAFYNNSAYDNNGSAANAADDGAIAEDKRALLPGQPASFANVTSFDRGINGVMVDVSSLPHGATLSTADFDFGTAVPPTSVTVRRGAGIAGSDRITLIWPDGAIKNTWLRVTVKANANTGLPGPDVFSFGNVVGETGDGPLRVTGADLVGVWRNRASSGTLVTSRHDFNRDARVDVRDLAIVRRSLGNAIALPAADTPAVMIAPRATDLFSNGRNTARRGSYELLV